MSTEPISADYDGPVGRQIAGLLEEDRRKAALAVLVAAPRPVPEAALALAVAVRTGDGEPAEVDDEARRSVRLALHHSDLPKLEDFELVERDTDARTVDVTDSGRELGHQVQGGDGGEGGVGADGGARTTVGTDGRRERLPVLATLSTLEAPVELHPLAEALVDQHEGWNDLETAAIMLHHVALPRLADAGLVSYDATAKRIQAR